MKSLLSPDWLSRRTFVSTVALPVVSAFVAVDCLDLASCTRTDSLDLTSSATLLRSVSSSSASAVMVFSTFWRLSTVFTSAVDWREL